MPHGVARLAGKGRVMPAGIISTRRQAAAEAERRRGEDAEDVSSAHMAEPASQVLSHLTLHSTLPSLTHSGVFSPVVSYPLVCLFCVCV